jgi:hypothetical protein
MIIYVGPLGLYQMLNKINIITWYNEMDFTGFKMKKNIYIF